MQEIASHHTKVNLDWISLVIKFGRLQLRCMYHVLRMYVCMYVCMYRAVLTFLSDPRKRGPEEALARFSRQQFDPGGVGKCARGALLLPCFMFILTFPFVARIGDTKKCGRGDVPSDRQPIQVQPASPELRSVDLQRPQADRLPHTLLYWLGFGCTAPSAAVSPEEHALLT